MLTAVLYTFRRSRAHTKYQRNFQYSVFPESPQIGYRLKEMRCCLFGTLIPLLRLLQLYTLLPFSINSFFSFKKCLLFLRLQYSYVISLISFLLLNLPISLSNARTLSLLITVACWVYMYIHVYSQI